MIQQNRKIAADNPLNAWRLQSSVILLLFFLLTQHSGRTSGSDFGLLLFALVVYIAVTVVLASQSAAGDDRFLAALSDLALKMALFGVAGTILLIGAAYRFPVRSERDFFTGVLGLSWMPTMFAIVIGRATRESKRSRWAFGIATTWLAGCTTVAGYLLVQTLFEAMYLQLGSK